MARSPASVCSVALSSVESSSGSGEDRSRAYTTSGAVVIRAASRGSEVSSSADSLSRTVIELACTASSRTLPRAAWLVSGPAPMPITWKGRPRMRAIIGRMPYPATDIFAPVKKLSSSPDRSNE